MATLLIIEDEEVLARALIRTLEKLGHVVHWVDRCEKGEAAFQQFRPDLVLLDLRLPDGSGLDVLARLRELEPGANVIIMTAYAAVDDAVQAIKRGARDYLQKPLDMDDVRHAVTRALEETQLKTEVSYFRTREARGAAVEGIQGTCAAIEDLRARVARLCALPADAVPPTVLVTGETGTGKGLVARVLHYNGPRAGKPFIEVNCAAIPDTLIESELFGHERGAFTDARTTRIGLFQAADGGTLFLDEIGCLPLAAQVKLLKAIEEKTVRPVGGRAARLVDVHVVAATNASLEQKVKAGEFREDLFYRLSVVRLVAPPLRERGDDVLLLARVVLREICERYRLAPKTLTPDAEDAMRRWSWPGNVRELRNLLDRAALFTEGPSIDARALGLAESAAGWIQIRYDASDGVEVGLPEAGIQFEELERALIVEALRKAGGKLVGAAKLLGMTRDTLRYRVEKFGIAPVGEKE